jgi:bacteriorhodopsin
MICNICTIAKLGGRQVHIVFNGRAIDWTRYVEWTFCCPLLVSEICVYGGFGTRTTIEMICFCLAFNMAGVMAAFCDELFIKIFLGAQGMVFYVCMEWLMWSAWRRIRVRMADKHMRLVVGINMLATVTIWPIYVLLWNMGSDMFQILSIDRELFAETIVSFVLKTVGASYIFISSALETREDGESDDGDHIVERITNGSIEMVRRSLEVVMNRA